MKILSISILCLVSLSLQAQNDTSAYTTQRNIVNRLLTERSEKFDKYDSSLKRRTGIFGLKTKKDMQASNDILTEIVLTDNRIFTELKTLLDYKDFEKKETENRAENSENRIKRYQLTITGLQQENDKIRTENEMLNKKNSGLSVYLYLLVLILLISAFYIYKLKILPKTDAKTVKNE